MESLTFRLCKHSRGYLVLFFNDKKSQRSLFFVYECFEFVQNHTFFQAVFSQSVLSRFAMTLLILYNSLPSNTPLEIQINSLLNKQHKTTYFTLL